MRILRRRALAGIAALACLGLAACSGNSGSTDPSGAAPASPGSLRGQKLTLIAMNDPFAPTLKTLAAEWGQQNGVGIQVDVVGYGDLATRVRSDFVGRTANFDLLTMDIVWTGEFAEAGYTADLTKLIERDKDQLQLDDIYDAAWTQGKWGDKQVAFPLAGYVNLLNYRTDVFQQKGLEAPKTLEQLESAALAIGKSGTPAGWVANGQQGPAAAQDWMAYAFQSGGQILDTAGKPVVNSAVNVKSLETYKKLFDGAAPGGAKEFDWGQRETAFTQGQAAMVESWSVSRASYEKPDVSTVAGKVATVPAPMASGVTPKYAFGGWGLAINSASEHQAAAWEFIKWVTSPDVQKRWVADGAGSYIRKSTVEDKELLAKYPFQDVIGEALTNGDGDARPRVPQYSEIETAVGTAVSKVLTQNVSAQAALDEAQDTVAKLF
ncbi:ABC transporter substrate-binding protein [Acrocarpospora pleiomorpha]|uniref:ABC transporter substrate-binding protein n=1 Tax=Acrocarpospora pleiomorpha TaxID=90975 RepID=A0A5M3XUR0_9ACTN|nr:extracellular solute-binding protein [Acrocarpospora pleiomorpha]GES24934.1 ABC transporter substrate-binding protein [Acrocarpospora pleiomorpha]